MTYIVNEANPSGYLAGPNLIPEHPASVASLLGLSNGHELDALALADLIAAGLPFRSAEVVNGLLEPLGTNPIHAIVSEPTLRRAKNKKRPLSREASGRIYDMVRVLARLLRMYHGDRAKAVGFLGRNHPLLDGRKPFDVVRASAAGADAVLVLLDQAEASVAV